METELNDVKEQVNNKNIPLVMCRGVYYTKYEGGGGRNGVIAAGGKIKI